MSTVLRDTLDLYDVVCDVCGHGTRHRSMAAGGRLVDRRIPRLAHLDRPGRSVRRLRRAVAGAHQAAAVPLQDPRVGVVVTVLLVAVCLLLLIGLWVR